MPYMQYCHQARMVADFYCYLFVSSLVATIIADHYHYVWSPRPITPIIHAADERQRAATSAR